MTARERQRRNVEIFAASKVGEPAREIARRTRLTKRQVNRIIETERAERHCVDGQRNDQDPAVSVQQILDEMERMYVEASYAAARGGSTGAVIVAPSLRMVWRSKRAALEQLIVGS